MPRAYSSAVVRDALHTYFALRSLRASARASGVSKSTIHRWVHSIGRLVQRKARHPKRSAKKREAAAKIIAVTLQSDPFVCVDALLERVRTAGCDASRATVHRAIRALRYSWKVACKRPGMTNPETIVAKRAAFEDAFVEVDIHDIVSVDEASFDVAMMPLRGYAPVGRRLEVLTPTRNRSRQTLLMAVASTGVGAWKAFDGSCNKSLFADFVRTELAALPQKYVLMDNVAFHRSDVVLEALREAGKQALFSPPYSPDYNPIENVFSVLKHRWRARLWAGRSGTVQNVTAFVSSVAAALPTSGAFDTVRRLCEKNTAFRQAARRLRAADDQ